MPRRPRKATGGIVYHVLNRAVGKLKLFKQDDDYAAFERVLEEACERTETRLLSYCLMLMLTMSTRQDLDDDVVGLARSEIG